MSYPRPAVSAVLFNREGKVLLTKRSSRVWEPGKWCVPGGHVEGGLSWREAVRQEVIEEVGLTVRAEKLVGIYSDPETNHIRAPLDGKVTDLYFLVACFLVTDYVGEIVLNEEADAYDWFDPHALPEPMLESEPQKILDAVAFQGRAFVR
jgi:8-oxo-dGTP pyrophosphatase MutT (NUDIX family)